MDGTRYGVETSPNETRPVSLRGTLRTRGMSYGGRVLVFVPKVVPP